MASKPFSVDVSSEEGYTDLCSRFTLNVSESWGEAAGKMHGLRYYEVRLRRSGRLPYVIARRLLAAGVLLAFLLIIFRRV
jgi:hypothetical protein